MRTRGPLGSSATCRCGITGAFLSHDTCFDNVRRSQVYVDCLFGVRGENASDFCQARARIITWAIWCSVWCSILVRGCWDFSQPEEPPPQGEVAGHALGRLLLWGGFTALVSAASSAIVCLGCVVTVEVAYWTTAKLAPTWLPLIVFNKRSTCAVGALSPSPPPRSF